MNQESGNFWNRFKTSTKSLSTSFGHMSIKPEVDGDSETSTVVHKAFVKYYKNQEPFTGFPSWLGHKEDLPDEQKILRRQTEHLEKQRRQQEKEQQEREHPTGFNAIKRAASSVANSPGQLHRRTTSTEEKQPQGYTPAAERRSRPSDAFQGIYKTEDADGYARRTSQPAEMTKSKAESDIPTRSSSGRSNRIGRPSWSVGMTANSGAAPSDENKRPELMSQSSQLMSDRLRRKTRG